MSRSWCARSDSRARSVGPCAGGGSQLRALVSGRGFAASPVGAPGFAFEDQRRRSRRLMHEADADAAVGIGEHLRRHVALGQLIAGRQHDRRVPDADRAIEHDAVAVAAVALRVLVGLDDAQARLAAVGRHRARARCTSTPVLLTVNLSGAPVITSTTPSSFAGAVVRPAPMPS